MSFNLMYPLRSLLSKKYRTVVVVIGIAIAMSLPMVIGITFDSSVGAIYTDLVQSVPDDVRLTLASMPYETAYQQLTEFTSSSSLQPLNFSLRYTKRQSVMSNSSDTLVSIVAIDTQSDWFVDALELDLGTLTNITGNCVIVSKALASELRLTVGSNLQIIDHVLNLDIQVSGVFHRLGYVDESAIVISLDWLHSSWNTTVVNEAGIVFAGGNINVDNYPEHISELVVQLKSFFGQSNMRLERSAILMREKSKIDMYRQSMSLVLLLALFAGCAATVAFVVLAYHEQLYETSLLKTVGFRKHQLILYPFVTTTALVLCGSAVAILISIHISTLVCRYNLLTSSASGIIGTVDLSQTTLRIQPQSLLQPIITLFVISLIAATYPAMRSAHVSCVEGLRPRARSEDRFSKNRIIPVVGLVGLTFSSAQFSQIAAGTIVTVFNQTVVGNILLITVVCFALLVSLALVNLLSRISQLFAPSLHGLELVLKRNLTQNRLRSWAITCQFAITILVVLGLTIMSSLIVDTAITDAYLANGSDITLSGSYQASDTNRIAAVQGVECTASIMYYDLCQTNVNGVTAVESIGEIRSYFIDPKNYSRTCRWEWISETSRTWLPALASFETHPNSTIISAQVADQLEVSTGDTVTVEIGFNDEITVFNSDCLVIAVVDEMPGIGNLYTPVVVLSTGQIDNITNIGLMGDRMLVRTASGSVDVHEVASEISEHLPSHLMMSVSITKDLTEDWLKQWSTLMLTYESMASFSMILAGVTLTVIMIASVMDRRFEYGVLRAIGVPWVRRLVVAESLTIGIMGFVTGGMLVVIFWAIGALGVTSWGVNMATNIAISGLVVLLMIVGLSLVVGLLSSRYIECDTPMASLRRASH